jgi:hypothetical protein
MEDSHAALNALATIVGDPLPYPNLNWDLLSEEMQEKVVHHIAQVLIEGGRQGRPESDMRYLYLAALEHFGIRCPHPRRVSYRDGFECMICKSLVFPSLFSSQ